jgi:hypothetical protein
MYVREAMTVEIFSREERERREDVALARRADYHFNRLANLMSELKKRCARSLHNPFAPFA